MKKTFTILVILLLSAIAPAIHAQAWLQEPYLKTSSDSSSPNNFYEIQKAFQLYEKEFDLKGDREGMDVEVGENEGKFDGYKQYKRWEWYMEPRVYPSGDITLPSTKQREFQKYLNSKEYIKSSTTSAGFSGDWIPLGPTGTNWHGYFGGAARVSFLRFAPNDSNIMWTFAPSGGLWKTTNGGLNWSSNTDQLPIIGCTDLAINPLNTQIMYLATGDGNGTGSQLWQSSIGVLKSTDGGATWPLASNTMNWQISWGRSIYKLLINPVHPDTVFAATSNGLYRTVNGGVNWNIVQAGLFPDVEFKPGNPDVVYAVSGIQSNGTFYKSVDGGSTFVSIATGLPSSLSVGRLEIGVTAADPNYVYVVAVKKVTNDFYGFYQSVDGGDNFSFRSNTPNILSGIPSSQAHYNLAMAVSPFHKDTVIVGATETWKSVDGGVTWAKHTSTTGAGAPFVHPDIHGIEFLPGTDSTYFSCNDGGVWKTTDYGLTWNPMNEGLQIAQMYRLGTSKINPYTFITGHQDMATHRLQSNNWDIVTPNTGDGMESIFENDNDSIMYLESYNGRIIKAINTFPLFNVVCSFGGAGVNATGNWITPVIMHPVYDTVLLVGKAQVWRTVNGGTSFTQVGTIPATGGNMVALAYAHSNDNFIYAAKANYFHVATDGNTFIDRTAGLPVPASAITAIAVSNTDPAKVWVTFSGYNSANKVWASSDTGKNWVNYSAGLPNLPVNCIVYQNNSTNSLFVGTDIGVYFKTDSLATWQPYFTGLPNVDVEELEINYSLNKLRAATNGRGLWETNIVNGTILPVQLISFTGHYNEVSQANDLQWVTASETNSKYFEIMKSANGIDFMPIGKVNSSGNPQGNSLYTYRDQDPFQGFNYYQLKQVDVDGQAKNSGIVSIYVKKKTADLVIYPNPSSSNISVTYADGFEGTRVEVINLTGVAVTDRTFLITETNRKRILNISGLPAGIYFLKLTGKSGEIVFSKPITKL
ncbi:MAG: T9SS type A sorting domain-containing protein [Chitinophagaceae bacterium]|nr:T9SS type A sorting domain-containing protein [Chitinophagaceae bacterium]